MKVKMKQTRQGILLKGESTAREDLLYAEAECVRAGRIESFFPLSYHAKGKGYAFDYFLGTARPLKDVLKAPLPADRFNAMLLSFLRVAQACDAHGLSLQRVFFDEGFLLFDPACYGLRFVYAPVRGTNRSLGDPLPALALLAQRARLSDNASRALAFAVLDYARRSPVFSWPEYEGLLREHRILHHHTAPAPVPTPRPRQDHRHLHGYPFP